MATGSGIDLDLKVAGPNPFSTSRFRPGKLAYLFAADSSPEDCISRLRCRGWRGQIVGPHGTGKSTLLHALAPSLKKLGRDLRWFTQHQKQRRLQIRWSQTRQWNAQTLVIVDGYEQLGSVQRCLLKWACFLRKSGLLVTAHDSVGLPTIIVTSSSPNLTHSLAQQLAGENLTIPEDITRQLFVRHQGNVREIFFDLYDRYEQEVQENFTSSS